MKRELKYNKPISTGRTVVSFSLDYIPAGNCEHGAEK